MVSERDGFLDQRRVDLAVEELAYQVISKARRRPISGSPAVPSQNRSLAPPRNRCAAVDPSAGHRQSAHHRPVPQSLALDQVGGGGDLVATAISVIEFVTVRVARPGVAVQHWQFRPRRSRRRPARYARPWAHRRRPVPDPHPSRRVVARAGIRISWEQREFGRRARITSTPAAARTSPGDFQDSVRPCRPGTRLPPRRSACGAGHRGRQRPPGRARSGLALGDDLAGDHHHVVVAQPRAAVAMAAARSTSWRNSGKPSTGRITVSGAAALCSVMAVAGRSRPANSIPARTISAVASGIGHQQESKDRDAGHPAFIALMHHPGSPAVRCRRCAP